MIYSGGKTMQANKYYSLALAVMAGITTMSDHPQKWYIATWVLVVAVLWVNGLLFGERDEVDV